MRPPPWDPGSVGDSAPPGPEAEIHAENLRQRGFTVFERVYSTAWVAALRAEILAIWAEVQGSQTNSLRLKPYDPGHRDLGSDLALCPAGFAIRSLHRHLPQWTRDLLHPAVVATIRRVLGDGFVLEIAGAVLSDRSRPFFGWHTHVGGIDDNHYRHSGH